MPAQRPIVTIDGPSGVGKSSVSRVIAAKLHYTYLDTGAMYRGVGYYFFNLGMEYEDEEKIALRLDEIDIALKPATGADDEVGVIVNGEDISDKIRTPELSMIASKISALPSVRQFLTKIQRKIAGSGNVVAEGRDMGTVVFPDAAYKFFLDAAPEERCRRRLNQMKQKGVTADAQKTLAMIVERDKNDSERAVAPLKKAQDAHYVDTTGLSLEDVCGVILAAIRG